MSASEMEQYRTSFVLKDEPEGAQSVLDVREALTGEAGEDHDGHDHDAHGHEGHDGDEHDEDAHDEHSSHDNDEGHEDGHDGHAGHDEDGHAHAAEGEEATESKEVVLVGSIGGVANPWAETEPAFPFSKDHAVLFVVDSAELLEIDAHAHNHAPGEECAFCAAHAGDQSKLMARVEFKNKDGKLLTVATQKLFELKEKQTVVIKGKARVAPGGTLVVDADGLYVRN